MDNNECRIWREAMAPLFDELNIHIAFQGHSHVYEVIGPVYGRELAQGAVSNVQAVPYHFPKNVSGKSGGIFNATGGTLYFLNNRSGHFNVNPKDYNQIPNTPAYGIPNYRSLFTGRLGQNGKPTYSNVSVTSDIITITTYEIVNGNSQLLDEIRIEKYCKPYTHEILTFTGDQTHTHVNYVIKDTLRIKNNATVTFTNSTLSFYDNAVVIVEPGGKLVIDGGTLNWLSDANSKVDTSSLVVNNGTLNIGASNIGSVLDLNNAADVIAAAATVNLAEGSALTISDAGTVTINNGDTWAGEINLTGADGNLVVDNFVNSGVSCYTQTGGHALITNNSELTLCNDSSISGGDLTINEDSVLNISTRTIISDETHVNLDNGYINSMDGMLSNHNFGIGCLSCPTDTPAGGGVGNFSVDVNGTNFTSDTFTFKEINGNVNVTEFVFLSQPAAYEFDIPVFFAENIRGGVQLDGTISPGSLTAPVEPGTYADATDPAFTASQSQVVAPVGIRF